MPSTPSAPHRRDLRRWDRRRRRTTVRRRLWVVAAVASVLAVGSAVHLVAPGSRADAFDQLAALVPLDLQRDAGAASRSSERSASPTTDAAGEGTAEVAGTPAPGAGSTGVATSDPAAEPSPTPADASSGSPSDPAGGASEDPADGAVGGAADQAAAPAGDGSTSAGSAAPASAPGAATAPGAASAPTLTQQVVDLTNAERAAAGLPALTVSACATAQAQGRTDVLVAEDRFEHDPLGPVMRECGAGGVGENLALGYPDAPTMVAGWMASPGHRANILRSGYTSIGVACTSGSRGLLCAQVFLS